MNSLIHNQEQLVWFSAQGVTDKDSNFWTLGSCQQRQKFVWHHAAQTVTPYHWLRRKEKAFHLFLCSKKKKVPQQCNGSHSEFCSSLRDLIQPIQLSLNPWTGHTWVTSYFTAPARTSSLSSMFIYPTADLTSPPACLREISRFMF